MRESSRTLRGYKKSQKKMTGQGNYPGTFGSYSYRCDTSGVQSSYHAQIFNNDVTYSYFATLGHIHVLNRSVTWSVSDFSVCVQ